MWMTQGLVIIQENEDDLQRAMFQLQQVARDYSLLISLKRLKLWLLTVNINFIYSEKFAKLPNLSKLFYELINIYLRKLNTHLFTDGSRTDRNNGCAVILPGHEYLFRLDEV